MSITDTSAWKELQKHYQQSKDKPIKALFDNDAHRAKTFSLDLPSLGFFLDYSKNRMTNETMQLLTELAKQANLSGAINDLFSGKPINFTEERQVLHTDLRQPEPKAEIRKAFEKMANFVDSIHDETYRGHSSQAITDVVNIGIGGSDLGPHLVVDALKPYHVKGVQVHFVSNVDGHDILETLQNLNPETTLFIVASKTFTTIETLTNATTAKQWLINHFNDDTSTDKHFVAVTASPSKAKDFGINPNNIFTFWDWVGGRYSLWSTIGLPIALAIGNDNFNQLLAGAHTMDEHFRSAPFAENMPVILALLSIWYTNFYHCQTQAIIPYHHNLRLLPDYLQQLEMESNGKSVTRDNANVDYNTAPIIWGGVGTNGQHAFHQLLHQGTHIIPVDFIVALNAHHKLPHQQQLLYHNCLAQSQALMQGSTFDENLEALKHNNELSEDKKQQLAHHKVIPGNKPSNTLVMHELNPKTLGGLIALYEHKVFAQGIIWEINSFDQFGVELGKKMSQSLANPKNEKLDGSTTQLMALLSNK